ncbi:hypothetical protein KAR34_08890 [bacterium]|nr:hypothetical protein [bacterium]
MKKMILILVAAPLLLCSCSNEEIIIQKIVNDSLESVKKSQDFNREEIDKYRVGDAIIKPFFRNHDKDVYSFHFTALSKNQKLKSAKIISYKLIIDEGEDEVSLAKQVDTRLIFKPHRDDTAWGKGVMFVGIKLFDKTQLIVDENSKIKLILEVEIEGAEESVERILEYDLRYDEDKYLAVFSR